MTATATATCRDDVLVLDFQSRIAGAIREMLTESGYSVTAPRTAAEASEYFERRAGEIAFVIVHAEHAHTAMLIQIMRPDLRVFLFHEAGTVKPDGQAARPRLSSLRSFP